MSGTTSTINLEKHVDFNRPNQTDIDPSNYNWVGAWWISFCAAAGIAICFAVPMFGFPKQLPGVAEIKFREGRKKKVENSDETEICKFVKMTKTIWTNPIIVAIIFAQIFETILESGISAFGLKYVEQQYYLTPMDAGVFAAVCMVIAAVVGIVLNGLIIKFVKMNRQQCCYLYLSMGFVNFVSIFIFYLTKFIMLSSL